MLKKLSIRDKSSMYISGTIFNGDGNTKVDQLNLWGFPRGNNANRKS